MADELDPSDFPATATRCGHNRVEDVVRAVRAELLDSAVRMAAIKTAVETRLGHTLTARQFVRALYTLLARWAREN